MVRYYVKYNPVIQLWAEKQKALHSESSFCFLGLTVQWPSVEQTRVLK